MSAHKLSIIIPVYNEKATVLEIVRRVRAVKLPIPSELVIVDDGSTDGTRELLKQVAGPDVAVISQPNQGKGKAIQTGLERVSGDIVLIQDADLEYDPRDYPVLLTPILEEQADVVFGSRFLGSTHRVLLFWHYMANKGFTFLTNLLYNINLTDMGTCYKVFRTPVLKSLKIKSNGFGFEPEVTAKICRKNLRIYETSISYHGRSYEEGKKITWKDGLVYLYALVKYRFFD